MSNLRVKIGSLELDNPIIVSSGHVTRRGDAIKKADKFGPGAIIMKSTLLEEEYKQVVKPYQPGKFPDARASFALGADGIINICGLSHIPLEEWVKWFKKEKKEIGTPVIASAMATSVEGYVKGAKMFEEAGADALEIPLACPLPYLYPFKYLGASSCFDAQIVEEICTEVKKAVSIPLGVKLAWNPLDPTPLRIPQKVGLDFVTIVWGAPAAPGIDLDIQEPIIPSSVGIAGSRVAKYANFVGILTMADLVNKIHISASGGCQSWEDIVEYLMYGASSVQLQSIFIQKGFRVIKDLKEGILKYMEQKNFETIEEMKGIIFPKLLTYNECIAAYGQTKGKVVVSVDMKECNLCGLCEDTCMFDAIRVSDERVTIIEDNCEGCRACVISCSQDALTLQNVDQIKKIARG